METLRHGFRSCYLKAIHLKPPVLKTDRRQKRARRLGLFLGASTTTLLSCSVLYVETETKLAVLEYRPRKFGGISSWLSPVGQKWLQQKWYLPSQADHPVWINHRDWILSIHFLQSRETQMKLLMKTACKCLSKTVCASSSPCFALAYTTLVFCRGGKPSDLPHKAQTNKNTSRSHLDSVSLKYKDLPVRTVFILHLHNLDMTKDFQALSAAIPYTLR